MKRSRWTVIVAGAICFCGASTSAQGYPTWDTLSTACIRLLVSSQGDVGRFGEGSVNMDFKAFGGECDTSAKVYLYDGGPIVIRKSGSNYILNTPLYQVDLFTQKTFRPFAVGPVAGPISGPGYTGYFTGMLINTDTSVGLYRTYYAPTFGNDTCNFIIQKTQFFGIGGPKSHVTLGEINDWDIPSAVDHANSGHMLGSKGVMYQQGIDTSANGCQSNANRFGTVALLGMYTTQQYAADPCAKDNGLYGAYIMLTDSLLKYDSLSNSAEGEYFWTRMGAFSGLTAPAVQNVDMNMVTTYKWDYSLNDTLTVFTALISVKNGTVSDLPASIDKAKVWYDTLRHCGNCCLANSIDGRTGNVDCSPDKKVDISDLTCLIDGLYFWPYINCDCCPAAKNIDGDPSGGVDIADLSALIDYLYISFTPLALCH
jgi:hypothetical protein